MKENLIILIRNATVDIIKWKLFFEKKKNNFINNLAINLKL